MSVNFGSFSEIGGRQVIGGVASNLDSQKMIEAMLKDDEKPIKAIDDTISNNAKKINAYHRFENLIEGFQRSLNSFYDPLSSTIFQNKKISLTANANINADNYVSIEQLPNVNIEINNFSISNIKLSTKEVSSAKGFHDRISSVVSATPISGQFTAGTFQINGIDITINEGDSLETIAKAINNSQNAKVKASILKLKEDDYQLSITSLDEGIQNAFIYTDDNHVFFESSNITWANIAAQDTTFNFDGNEISRSSNVIEDLVEGLKITLHQSTFTDTEIKVNISSDTDAIVDSVKEFIHCFNALIIFYEEMNQRDEETSQYSDISPLGGDRILNNIINNIKSLVNTNFLWLGETKYTSLDSLGIKYLIDPQDVEINNSNYDPSLPKSHKNSPTISIKVDGGLHLTDEKILRNALKENIEDVRRLFTMEYSSTNSKFSLRDAAKDTSITKLDINMIKTNTISELTTKHFTSDKESVVFSNPTADKYLAGTFKINNIDITLSAGNSIRDIANSINNLVSNVSAVVKQEGKSYRLELQPKNRLRSFTVDDPNKIFLNNPKASVKYKLAPGSVTASYQNNKPHVLTILNSKGFISDTESIVSSTPEPDKYLAGIFKINNIYITLTAGKNIREIADSINALTDTPVSAKVIQDNNLYMLQLRPKRGSSFTILDQGKIFFNNPNIVNLEAENTAFGFSLRAMDHTDLSGLAINYHGGHNPDQTNINYSQGIMYQLQTHTKPIIKAGYNSLAKEEIQNLEKNNIFNKEERKRLQEKLERRKIELLENFAKVEGSIAKVNSVLKFLDNDETSKRLAAR
ncbi:Flagellar hook-associated protein 2 [Rickettsiales bacterium Ac37b]|nr:Flagellar hook-associated protein 2 [Rickettsiales bacterium Ac37b]